ncbi:MAG: PaaI family thioesterase [Desulfomonile sp.]|nr:PaaI family thioesterase [Desulfomonile sp.]
MSETFCDQLRKRSLSEPYAGLLGIEVAEVGEGSARVRMRVRPELANIFGATHGGALFSLIDEAFQLACNAHGILSVALNVSITYVAPPKGAALLEATAHEMYRTRRTSSYVCEIRDPESGKLVATAQALAYRTGKEIDLSEGS